jgi:4-hydroxybenzoate polyprenyltransferase
VPRAVPPPRPEPGPPAFRRPRGQRDCLAHNVTETGRPLVAEPGHRGVTPAIVGAGLPARLARFVLERFPPLAYGILIGALVLCGAAAASLSAERPLEVGPATLVAALAVVAAFLQLRILDELRDEAADRIGRPHRPVPRGLVTAAELRAFAIASAVTGIALAATAGVAPFAVYLVAVAAIWVFGLDMPARVARHPGPLANALLHSVITPSLLVFTWAAGAPAGPDGILAAAILLAWGASLALELSRKTFRPEEERAGIESYSRTLGRSRALLAAGLAHGAAWLGAGTLAAIAGAPAAVWVPPLVVAVAIPALAPTTGDRLGGRTLEAVASVLVLAVLLWPVVATGAVAGGAP